MGCGDLGTELGDRGGADHDVLALVDDDLGDDRRALGVCDGGEGQQEGGGRCSSGSRGTCSHRSPYQVKYGTGMAAEAVRIMRPDSQTGVVARRLHGARRVLPGDCRLAGPAHRSSTAKMIRANKWTTPILTRTVHGDGTATPVTTDRDRAGGRAGRDPRAPDRPGLPEPGGQGSADSCRPLETRACRPSKPPGCMRKRPTARWRRRPAWMAA